MNLDPPDGITPEEFVARSGWRYAKTMPGCPHEYTVRDLSPGGAKTTAMGDTEFEWFARLIREKGELLEWGGKVKPYLRVGGWKYWTMGEPIEETTIINREPVTPETWAELAERIRLSAGGRLLMAEARGQSSRQAVEPVCPEP